MPSRSGDHLKQTIITLFLSLAFLCASLLHAEPEMADLNLNLNAFASGHDEGSNYSRKGGMILTADFYQYLPHSLIVNVRGFMRAEEGTSQHFLQDDYGPTSELEIDQARIQWSPYYWLYLDFGLIDQDDLKNPLLINRESFLGAKQQVSYGVFGNTRLFITSQQTYASGQRTLSQQEEKTNQPLFFYEGIGLQRNYTTGASYHIRAGHYLFKDLHSEAASRSRIYGGLVTGTTPQDTEFQHKFSGYHADFGFSYGFRLARVKPGFSVSYAENTSYDEQNQSYLSKLFFEDKYEFYKITYHAGNYLTGAAVTPPLYGPRKLGHANYRGYYGGITLGLKEDPMSFSFELVSAEVVEENPFQEEFIYAIVSFQSKFFVF